MPENFQETTWKKLEGAVDAIHSSCSIRYSLEELYKAVENMCSYKMATGLYSQLMSRCQKHVRANLGQFLAYPFLNSLLSHFGSLLPQNTFVSWGIQLTEFTIIITTVTVAAWSSEKSTSNITVWFMTVLGDITIAMSCDSCLLCHQLHHCICCGNILNLVYQLH